MDLNGSGGPNAEPDDSGKYYDIRSFRIARFSNKSTLSCEANGGTKINDVCVVILDKNYSPLNCTLEKNSSYCEFTASTEPTVADYWAGANKACKNLGMKLPDRGTGGAIIDQSNGLLSSSAGAYWTTTSTGYGEYGGYRAGTKTQFWPQRTQYLKVFCIE